MNRKSMEIFELSEIQRRYPNPNRPLTPAWLNPRTADRIGQKGSLWTVGIYGRDRGHMHQGVLILPGASTLKLVLIELAMTVKAILLWTVIWAVIGLGLLCGIIGMADLIN